jgi:hypothetical protein
MEKGDAVRLLVEKGDAVRLLGLTFFSQAGWILTQHPFLTNINERDYLK